MKKLIIILTLLFGTICIADAQSYGIIEGYYDPESKSITYGLSTYAPIIDSTIEWSSYSWAWNKEIMSRQWLQYWPTKRFGFGMEIEIWYTYNRDYYHDPNWKPFKLYITPRLGMQYKLW